MNVRCYAGVRCAEALQKEPLNGELIYTCAFVRRCQTLKWSLKKRTLSYVCHGWGPSEGPLKRGLIYKCAILPGVRCAGERVVDSVDAGKRAAQSHGGGVVMYIYVYMCVCVFVYICVYICRLCWRRQMRSSSTWKRCCYVYICIYMYIYMCLYMSTLLTQANAQLKHMEEVLLRIYMYIYVYIYVFIYVDSVDAGKRAAQAQGEGVVMYICIYSYMYVNL